MAASPHPASAPDAPAPALTARGTVAALRRHPVKGFTPEPLERVTLTAGAPFPGDRLYAVESGPSGFDPSAPAHVSKQRFTVLAAIPAVARVRTRWDDAAGDFHAEAPGAHPFHDRLDDERGRAAFAAWLTPVLDRLDPDARRGALRTLDGAGWRFFDDQQGEVSVLNLASIRDLADRMGAPLDPERFRGNVWVEGWSAWAEMDLADGARVRLGGAELEVVKPIRRCVATHVDPDTGMRDREVVPALLQQYSHAYLGLYLRVVAGGEVATGDAAAFAS